MRGSTIGLPPSGGSSVTKAANFGDQSFVRIFLGLLLVVLSVFAPRKEAAAAGVGYAYDRLNRLVGVAREIGMPQVSVSRTGRRADG
jgi:hypothetical protein